MQRKFLIKMLVILVVLEGISFLWPQRHLASFFGSYKQTAYVVSAVTYRGRNFSVDYPNTWNSTDLSNEPAAQGLVPNIAELVGFGPHDIGEHLVVVSGNTEDEVRSALIAREQADGRALQETTPLSVNGAAATKYSFQPANSTTNAMTYYVLPSGGRIYIIRIHGPGAKDLDTAAEMMLKTFRTK